MDVTRMGDVEAVRRPGEIFETQVHKKPGVTEAFGEHEISLGEVFFAPGERTVVHAHTVRQILYVTEGEGVVASDTDRHEVSTGDVISIPPDEEHWHGATPESTFAHLSIVIADENGEGTFAVEEPTGKRTE